MRALRLRPLPTWGSREEGVRGDARGSRLEDVVEPVVDASERWSLRADLTVGARAFGGGEPQQHLGAGEVIVQLLRLPDEEQVLFGVADQ